GILMLAVISPPLLCLRRARPQVRASQWAPVVACCAILTLLAASTRISLGSRVLVDLDPAQPFTKYFPPLRATGRLFWAPYYAILIAVLSSTFLVFRWRTATALTALALALQLADTTSLRQWVHLQSSLDFHPTPLQSPIWSRLGTRYENLMVVPA